MEYKQANREKLGPRLVSEDKVCVASVEMEVILGSYYVQDAELVTHMYVLIKF